jgi:hypothetical protein
MEEAGYDWREGEFGAYSWHDNRIRGIRFRSPIDRYDCDLILKIDYIAQWIEQHRSFQFAVAPAQLVFHGAQDIRIDLKAAYREDLTVNCISRKDIASEDERKHGLSKYRFAIFVQGVCDRPNSVNLTASGFEMKLLAEPVLQSRQRLEDLPLDLAE